MKAFLVISSVLLFGFAAHADGFNCLTAEGDLAIDVYNSIDNSIGTRTGVFMIVSDPNVSLGRKTIASFTLGNETLTNSGANYTARVDLRFKESQSKGGTLLGLAWGM